MKARAKRIAQLQVVLATHFPKLFSKEHPLPLAIGVRREIKQAFPGVGVHTIYVVLNRWTARNHYLAALAEPRSVRHHLDGTVSEPVSAEHRQYAADEIERRQVALTF